MQSEDLELLSKYAPALSFLVGPGHCTSEQPHYNCDLCPFAEQVKGWAYDRSLPDVKCKLIGKEVNSSRPVCEVSQWKEQAIKELPPVIAKIKEDLCQYNRFFVSMNTAMLSAMSEDGQQLDLKSFAEARKFGDSFAMYCKERSAALHKEMQTLTD